MFTTLTVIRRRRKSLLERLHMVKKRRYLSEYHEYKGKGFYTTRLITYSADNCASIEKFKQRAGMPVITEQSPEALRYRYIVFVNTVFKINGSVNTAGLYDRDGSLGFLLPFLAANSGCICIFTEIQALYHRYSEEIYRCYGTPIILSNSISGLDRADIVFTPESLPLSCPFYILGADMPHQLKTPVDLRPLIPDYCNPYLAAAGLYFVENIKKLDRLIFYL